ncbi:hypothetical protein J4G43_030920 [Bradyrhizobium barranii subsp. barranii]|uniref:Uncharacterized protein n=1 Tax=Bradyrhizobium barranii subsp. barranii TaxID=2823807 RepID=A0A939MA41_9BRAD|nr:hypothetical protein [Bradyrhizobium barranii]UEM09147.1 hypothetical protein J4G43_030920 [Bradyrhizobium barranii subsp. barranii]
MSTQSGNGTDLKWSSPVLDLLLKYGPVAVVVVGAAWAAFTWIAQRSDQAGREETRQAEAARVAIRESQKPFLEKQLAFYFEAAKATAALSTRDPKDQEWASARKRFWELYWGELGVVESPQIASGMVAFGQTLRELEKCVDDGKTCDGLQRPLTGASLALAHSIRESIEAGWGYRLDELPAKK